MEMEDDSKSATEEGIVGSKIETKCHWVIPEKIHTSPTDGQFF